MVYNYGMAKMNRRATFALDEETITRIKKISLLWHVSQAEVVRKALEMADKQMEQQRDTKLSNLSLYHKSKGLDFEVADAYLQEVAENRSYWRRKK